MKSDVRNIALEARDDGNVTLARRDTKPFSMLGVSWTDPSAKVPGTIQAQTREAKSGKWSPWIQLAAEGDSLADPDVKGVRGATEPTWVGASDGVQLRVVKQNGKTSARLPKGLRLDLVDPGTGSGGDAAPAAYAVDDPTVSSTPTVSPNPSESADPSGTPTVTADPSGSPTASAPESQTPSPSGSTTGTPSASASPSSSAGATASPSVTPPTATAPPSTAPRPAIVSRSSWGADESISPEPPEYIGDVKAVFVHHSAGTNTYSCTDSAAIVRGIYAYHVETNGWKDIGYNFLVDKCGTIFEGRKGGVDKPVLGAHTYGFNRESTGISVLGDYNTTAASQATLTSVARIAAWKLGQYGGDPAGTVQLTAGATQKNYAGTAFTADAKYTFTRISGHRDGYNTECPGTQLYGQLPTIRSYAAGPVTGAVIKSVTGATLSGSTYYTKATATVGWSTTTPASLISKFELLVDGKVTATTAGTASSATVTLAPGTHQIAVRAVHQSGKTATTAAVTVVADTTAPTFTTKPVVTLRAGTVNTTAVPVTLGWKASDNGALKSVALTAPKAVTYGPTTTSASHTSTSGSATTWGMKATDSAGNTTTASTAVTPVILQETSAVRSGSWTTKSSTSYLGGKSYSSGSKNASLTWTFTGRSASWTVSRASTSGQAYVYVDGVKAATVDLKSSTTLYRQAIWTKSWTSSAKHVVKVVVVGTSGRPTITTDGLIYIK